MVNKAGPPGFNQNLYKSILYCIGTKHMQSFFVIIHFKTYYNNHLHDINNYKQLWDDLKYMERCIVYMQITCFYFLHKRIENLDI